MITFFWGGGWVRVGCEFGSALRALLAYRGFVAQGRFVAYCRSVVVGDEEGEF
jgi:hypothetical protein